MTINVSKLLEFKGHSGSVYTLEQGPEPHLFFSGSSDRFVAMWNLEKREQEKFAATFPAIVYSIAYVKGKEILLVGTSAGSLHILDLVKKEEIKILQLTVSGTNKHIPGIFDIKYSVKTNEIYCAGGDGSFSICSLPTGQAGLETLSAIKSKKLCEDKVRSIDICESRNEIAVGCGDGTIFIFDLITHEEKKNFKAHDASTNVVKYDPTGKFLLSGGKDAHLNIWETEKDLASIKKIPAHNFSIYSIVFNSDGDLFATGSRDKTIKIWNASTFELLKVISKEKNEGHINSVNKLLWSIFDDLLISTGDDRSIMIWDLSASSR